MAKKVSDAECLENYHKMCDLFKRVIADNERFSVVYGCGVDVGMSDFVVARKTTYTYSSYAIGYDKSAKEMVILPIDVDLKSYGNAIYLARSAVKKAKRSWLSKEINIQSSNLPKKYIQFTVPEMINQDDDNVCLCVKQNEQAADFTEFFKSTY